MSRHTTSSPFSLTFVFKCMLYFFCISLSFFSLSFLSSRSFCCCFLSWFSYSYSSFKRSSSIWFCRERRKLYSNSFGCCLMRASSSMRFFLVSLRSDSYRSSTRSLKLAFFLLLSMTRPRFLIISERLTFAAGILDGETGSSSSSLFNYLIFCLSSLVFFFLS